MTDDNTAPGADTTQVLSASPSARTIHDPELMRSLHEHIMDTSPESLWQDGESISIPVWQSVSMPSTRGTSLYALGDADCPRMHDAGSGSGFLFSDPSLGRGFVLHCSDSPSELDGFVSIGEGNITVDELGSDTLQLVYVPSGLVAA